MANICIKCGDKECYRPADRFTDVYKDVRILQYIGVDDISKYTVLTNGKIVCLEHAYVFSDGDVIEFRLPDKMADQTDNLKCDSELEVLKKFGPFTFGFFYGAVVTAVLVTIGYIIYHRL